MWKIINTHIDIFEKKNISYLHLIDLKDSIRSRRVIWFKHFCPYDKNITTHIGKKRIMKIIDKHFATNYRKYSKEILLNLVIAPMKHINNVTNKISTYTTNIIPPLETAEQSNYAK